MTTRHSKLARRVSLALQDDPRTSGAAIDVVDESAMVTLTGSVDSDDVRQAAQEIAQQQEGVLQVINDLQVQAPDEEDEMLVVAPPPHDAHGTLVGKSGDSR